ncbi:hypothetical protein ACFYKX_16100 [Cytobacillus sp. FJAT-54145]|uniref:Threonine dehydratase n=1 Tax=Cytobacillus spartinae TaxID=3299023 RepID=A0ABW6KD68_9BACI
MEFLLNVPDGALPVEVTLDEDNGRYMVRKSDTSGEFFNSPVELINWIQTNFNEDEFCDKAEFHHMISSFTDYLNNAKV